MAVRDELEFTRGQGCWWQEKGVWQGEKKLTRRKGALKRV